jgi:putative inorganic carbon (HCO3(-)) transporter
MPAHGSTNSSPWYAFPLQGTIRQYPLTLVLSVAIILSYVFSFSRFIDTSRHDDQRILEILFLLFAGAHALKISIQGNLSMASWAPRTRWMTGLFFLLGGISSMRAFSPRYAFYEQASLLLFLIAGANIADEISRNRDGAINLVLKLCGIGSALYGFTFMIVYFSVLLSGVQPEMTSLIPGFNSYRFLNHTQTITLPLLILLYVLDGHKRKPTWMLLTALWWALLFITGGRGTLVGIAAGVLIAALVQRQHAVAFCRAVLLTVLAGLVTYVLLFVLVPILCGMLPFGNFSELAQRSLRNPTSDRVILWHRAWEMIQAQPWFGVGPLHFSHYAINIRVAAHPHSSVMQIAAEWGLPALACLSLVLILSMCKLIRMKCKIAETDRRNQTMLTAWIATGIAILVDSQVSGLLVMPLSQLLIVLYFACATGWVGSFSTRPVLSSAVSSVKRSFQGVIVLACMTAILNASWPRIGTLIGLGQELTGDSLRYHRLFHPRLWADGYFGEPGDRGEP